MLNLLTNIAVFVCATAANVFVVRYMRTGWHRTEAGRHMMAFMGVTSVLLGLAVLNRITDLPAALWDQIRFVSFIALAWVLVQRVVLLFRYQHAEKEAREDEEEGVR